MSDAHEAAQARLDAMQPADSPGPITRVHLVRHGEVHNPQKILYGRLPDYHLSERGHAMAQMVAEHLRERDITTLVCSPLERAQETMKPVAEALGLSVTLDERVIEAGNQFEGQRFGSGDASLRQPRTWWLVRNPFRPSWGEPYQQIAQRMLAAIAAAREAAAGHEAVIVSHQLPVWTARLAVQKRRLWHDPRQRECALASVTTLTFVGQALASLEYGEPAASLLSDKAPPPGA